MKFVYIYVRPRGMTQAEAETAAHTWGVKDTKVESSPQFWVDVASKRRLKPGVDHASQRTEMIGNLRPSHKDVIGFPREDCAGRDEDDVDRVLSEILCKGFAVHFIGSGVTINPHPEARKQREAVDRASVYFKRSRVEARMDGKRRTGNMGGRPKMTDAKKALIKPIWIARNKDTISERERKMGLILGVEKDGLPHYASGSPRRWWGECGQGPSDKPERSKRRAKHAKRKS